MFILEDKKGRHRAVGIILQGGFYWGRIISSRPEEDFVRFYDSICK